jgi:hypothetical protein
MKEVDLGGVGSFIGAWLIGDTAVCDALIEYYRTSGRGTPGLSYDVAGNRRVDKSYKESTDCPILPVHHQDAPVARYFEQLRQVVGKYIEKYAYASAYGDWGITDVVNIQHYPPGGGFKSFHAERVNARPPATTRHLVFMTYLNDVTDQGGTEFFYQQVISPARKGLTLIWPADWTHTHRGVVSPTQEKYIITGWFNYF